MVNLITGLSGRLEDLSSMPETQGGAGGGATSRRAFRTPRSIIRARECSSDGAVPGVEAHVQVSEQAGGPGEAPGLRSRGGEGARVGLPGLEVLSRSWRHSSQTLIPKLLCLLLFFLLLPLLLLTPGTLFGASPSFSAI